MDDRDAAYILKQFFAQSVNEKYLVLEINPKSLILKNFCRILSGWMALVLYVRMFTNVFDKGSLKYDIL